MARLSPAQVLDQAVLHRIALSRYSTGVVRRIITLLNVGERALIERLLAAEGVVQGRALARLLAELRQLQAAAWATVQARMAVEMLDLAGAEIEFNRRLLTGMGAKPGPMEPASVVAAVDRHPYAGRTLDTWLADAEETAAKIVSDKVRQGFADGKAPADVVADIRGSKALNYKDGALETVRRRAESMARTAVTHASSVAAMESYREAGIEYWRFTAVLDHRTSLICGSLHGRVYPVGSGPLPPRHPNCRSVTTPVMPGETTEDFPSYQDWLKAQPVDVQDDILGPAKAALFRQGGLSIDRFVDSSGKVLSLEELKARDAAAFDALEKGAKAASKPPAFTDHELKALDVYTSNEFRAINGYLRGYRKGSERVADVIDGLDSAFGRAALSDDITVYRGVDAGTMAAIAPELRIGDVITDTGFLSTSMRLERAKEFQGPDGELWAIRAGKGQRGIDVSEKAHLGTGEREILFARGSRLKVVSYDHEARTFYLERQPD